MNKIWILIRNDISILKNRLSKNKPNKLVGMAVIAVFLLLCMVFALSSQSYALLLGLKGTGMEYYAIQMQLILVLFMSLMFAIMNSLAIVEKDTGFLLSLPITKNQIVFSKIIVKYVLEVGLFLLLLLPTLVIYFIMIEQNIMILINGLLMILILPLFMVGFIFIFNALINNMALRFKYYKIIKSMIMLLCFFGFMGIYFYAIGGMGDPSNIKPASFMDFFVDVITKNNYLNLLWILLASVASFILGVYLFSFLYGKSAKTYKNVGKKVEFKAINSSLTAIIKKEMKCYFSSTMYLFNTIIGYILILGAAVALFFINFDRNMIEIFAYLIVCFSLSTCCISNSSLSLEGKNFWILKAAPIKTKTIMNGKVLTNFILLFITMTIALILIVISGKIDPLICFLIYILGLAISVFVSYGGYFINLNFPKLDFKNETEVVKQSASSGISIFFFMIFFSIMPMLYLLFLNQYFELKWVMLIHIGVMILLDIGLIFITQRLNEKKLITL